MKTNLVCVLLMLMCTACSGGTEPDPEQPDASEGNAAHAGNFDAGPENQTPNFPHDYVCNPVWTVNRDAGTAFCVCENTSITCPRG